MTLTVDTVVEKYIAMRDKRTALKKAYEAEDNKYVEAMNKVESWLLMKANELGVDNFKTSAGTAIRGRDMKVAGKDWKAFHQFVLTNNQLDMFERRVSRNVLKSWMEENGGDVPPGLDIIWEQTMTVRRSTKGE